MVEIVDITLKCRKDLAREIEDHAVMGLGFSGGEIKLLAVVPTSVVTGQRLVLGESIIGMLHAAFENIVIATEATLTRLSGKQNRNRRN